MALAWSTIISIAYFSLYTILLLIVAFVVYKQGTHDTVMARSYAKDVWAQRKIYLAVLAHIYDTSTDIGVMIMWYGLMQNELNGEDYKDVDMKIYFWTGFTFMMLYRTFVIGYTVMEELFGDGGCCKKWYHIILAILDLYILVTVYESFTEAQKKINARQQNVQKSIELTTKKEAETVNETNDNEAPPANDKAAGKETTKKKDAIDAEIGIAFTQQTLQFGEAAIEAMPQVILQAAFIIRSANDEYLRTETPLFLIIFSLIASVISVANKYRWIDDIGMDSEHKGFKPKLKFPGCINYWYLLAAVWRYTHVITRFVLLSLIWGVCGGHWIGIYCAFSYIICMFIFAPSFDNDECGNFAVCCLSILLAWTLLPGLFLDGLQLKSYGPRWFDNLIGYVLVALFGSFTFECGICANAEFRQFGENSIIDGLFIIGCCTYILDIILFVPLWRNDIIVMADK